MRNKPRGCNSKSALPSADWDGSNDRTVYRKILCLVLRLKLRLSFGPGEQRAAPGVRPSVHPALGIVLVRVLLHRKALFCAEAT